MNNSVTVKKKTKTKDAFGSWTETKSVRFGNVPCRIQPISGIERVKLYDSGRVEITHRMFCPAKFKTISENDEIIEGSITYDVQVVRNIDKMNHHLEIELREVKPAL